MITPPPTTKIHFHSIISQEKNCSKITKQLFGKKVFGSIQQIQFISKDFGSDIECHSEAVKVSSNISKLVELGDEKVNFNDLYIPMSKAALLKKVNTNESGDIIGVGEFLSPYFFSSITIGEYVPEVNTTEVYTFCEFDEFKFEGLDFIEERFDEGVVS